MKTIFFARLMALTLALASSAQGAATDTYINNVNVIVPSPQNPTAPAVDAGTFINAGGATWDLTLSAPWRPANVRNFLNYGYFASAGSSNAAGFDFQTFPSTAGSPCRADVFANIGGGGRNGTMVFSGTNVVTPGSAIGTSRLLVDAWSITNTGTITMNFSSLARFSGWDIDLSYGTVQQLNPTMDEFAVLPPSDRLIFTNGLHSAGVLDNYWGVGITTNQIFGGLTGGTASSPTNIVTFRTGVSGPAGLSFTNATTYQVPYTVDASNIEWQVVALVNSNPAVSNLVFLQVGFGAAGTTNIEGRVILVEWIWSNTNSTTGQVTTNYLTLADMMQMDPPGLVPVGYSQLVGPTYVPTNYSFMSGLDFGASFLPTAPSTADTLDFFTVNSMQYSAYQALFSPSQMLPSDAPFGSVTNLPGRVEINAENSLNLTRANLSAVNYLGIRVTNNFLGSQDARLVAPYFDFQLHSTTGTMTLTNLITPYLPFPDGSITLWSGLWTNVTITGSGTNSSSMTNRYHVLFVDTDLRPTTLPKIETLILGVTNNATPSRDLFIADEVRVTRKFNLDARSLTLQANGPGAATPYGELHVLDGSIFGPQNTPGLQCLTNFGVFETLNTMFLCSAGSLSPYSPPSFNTPLRALINHGTISSQGMFLYTRLLESDGTINAGSGSFDLEKAALANFHGGSVLALNGNMSLAANYLYASNTTWNAGGTLTLLVTNCLDDGSYALNSADGLEGTNVWNIANGLSLPHLPPVASLLGTTIIATAGSNSTVLNTWAGADKGNNVAGFANNAAIGHLVLDGQYGSRFIFNPASFGNALYVDCLELQDTTADKQDASGDWSGIYVAPGMTIYYGDAVATHCALPGDISEKLNGRNGGRFVWVSGFNCGRYSSAFYRYKPEYGTTNRVNTPLATSGTINSWLGTGVDCDQGYANNANPCGPVPPWLLNTNPVAALLSLPALGSNAIDGLTFTSPITLPQVTSGEAFVASIASQAFTLSHDQLGFAKLSGPAWLTVARDGSLSGTPADSDLGLNSFRVSATTPDGLSASGTVRITVLPAPLASASLEFPPSSSPVPFTNAVGAYYGLFAPTNGVTAGSAGYVAIGTTRGRGFSGWLQVAGRRYPIHGLFDANGLASNNVPLSKTAALTVRLRSAFGGDQIRGSVSGTDWWAELVADRQVFTRFNTNRFAGAYTMVIPPDPDSAGGPGGYGIGTVRISPLGVVRWVGVLADGTAVSQSSALSKDGYWPLYAFNPAGSNLAISWMQFTNNYVGGRLVWTKLPYTRTKYYGGGFTNTVEAEAFRYTPPAAGARALPLNGGEGRIIFSGGGLSGTFTNAVGLSVKNVVLAKSLAEGLRVSLIPSSGWFKGSATDPGSAKVFLFQGVLDQQDGVGWGFSLGPVINGVGQSGPVYLCP